MNLIARNVDGGKPGEAERAPLRAPGKTGPYFAEDQSHREWRPLSVARRFKRGVPVALLQRRNILSGMDGTDSGVAASRAAQLMPSFHDDGVVAVREAGPAGLFFAVLPGWLAGRHKSAYNW